MNNKDVVDIDDDTDEMDDESFDDEDSEDAHFNKDKTESLSGLEKIDWDSGLSVDIEEIDELQKKMFALLNVLIDLKENRCRRKGNCYNGCGNYRI